MNEFLTKAQEAIALRWLVITKVILFSLVTLGLSWQTSTANLVVANLGPYELFNIAIGMLIMWGNNMISFIDKSASRIAAGKLPIGENGNTVIITKDEINK
jgi:hypothetical protein